VLVTQRCGYYALFSVLAFSVFTCLVSASTPALAEDATRSAAEKWRPKDGMYGQESGRAFTAPCENLPLHYIELSKREIAANEMYACKITKITDGAPDALKLNVNCHFESGKSKSVITLRKIDDKSFFMSFAKGQGSRFVYCHENDERGDSK
jgi:hypothetical protein